MSDVALQAPIKLKGRAAADAVLDEIKKDVEHLSGNGVVPKIAVLRIGERADDISYENGVKKVCAKCGVALETRVLPSDVETNAVEAALEELSADCSIHGILPFRPMPKNIDMRRVCASLAPNKDIDCLTPNSMASIYDRSIEGFLPCTALSVVELIKFYKIQLAGRCAAVVGRSQVVGRALALLLTDEDCTVTLCHSKTLDLPNVTREADIVVAAIGRPRFITAEHVRAGSVVVDVGINDDGAGGICGDADEASIIAAGVSAWSPVPGGVGSLTTALLVRAAVTSCKRSQRP